MQLLYWVWNMYMSTEIIGMKNASAFRKWRGKIHWDWRVFQLWKIISRMQEQEGFFVELNDNLLCQRSHMFARGGARIDYLSRRAPDYVGIEYDPMRSVDVVGPPPWLKSIGRGKSSGSDLGQCLYWGCLEGTCRWWSTGYDGFPECSATVCSEAC